MPKLSNVTNSMMSNPLVIVVIILFLVVIVLSVIRLFMPDFSAGVGLNAHVGTLKGSINLEAFQDEYPIENFKNSSTPQFVIFKAEWCGHCQRAMPEVKKLQNENIPGVEIIVVDSDEQPDLIKECDVKGFPTMRLYPEGLANKSNYENFDGERNLEGFKSFLERLMRT